MIFIFTPILLENIGTFDGFPHVVSSTNKKIDIIFLIWFGQ